MIVSMSNFTIVKNQRSIEIFGMYFRKSRAVNSFQCTARIYRFLSNIFANVFTDCVKFTQALA